MRLLLDTHAAVWFAEADPRLSASALAAIADPDNDVLLSPVVAWEVAIKRALRKSDVAQDYLRPLLGAGAREVPITIDHAQAVEYLPRHHGDPFDRLLIVQAQAEGAAIVTDDDKIQSYDVPIVW